MHLSTNLPAGANHVYEAKEIPWIWVFFSGNHDSLTIQPTFIERTLQEKYDQHVFLQDMSQWIACLLLVNPVLGITSLRDGITWKYFFQKTNNINTYQPTIRWYELNWPSTIIFEPPFTPFKKTILNPKMEVGGRCIPLIDFEMNQPLIFPCVSLMIFLGWLTVVRIGWFLSKSSSSGCWVGLTESICLNATSAMNKRPLVELYGISVPLN